MAHFTHQIQVDTSGQGLYEITGPVSRWVRSHEISAGLLTVFIQHTSASLVIQENADPDVCRDLQDFFAHLAMSGPRFRHTAEGPDDMPSHIRAALTQTSIAIPLVHGRPVLGTWQGIYVFEHRDAPHTRHITLHVIGA